MALILQYTPLDSVPDGRYACNITTIFSYLQNFLTFFQIITYDVNVTFMRMAVAKAVFSTKMARILLICQIEIKNI